MLAVRRTLGATPRDEGMVDFRVWSPNPGAVGLRLNGAEYELTRAGKPTATVTAA